MNPGVRDSRNDRSLEGITRFRGKKDAKRKGGREVTELSKHENGQLI